MQEKFESSTNMMNPSNLKYQCRKSDKHFLYERVWDSLSKAVFYKLHYGGETLDIDVNKTSSMSTVTWHVRIMAAFSTL